MLSRFDTGPLVRMVCIEAWANAHGGPQVRTATSSHAATESQPKQLNGLSKLIKLRELSEKAAFENLLGGCEQAEGASCGSHHGGRLGRSAPVLAQQPPTCPARWKVPR